MSESSYLSRPASSVQEEHARLTKEFYQRAEALGFSGLSDFYWFHTIDLGQGLITPGTYDYRDQLKHFHFPENMQGMKVLDVGSATGFFSFEFEKRGADVTSVELPSFLALDCFPGETIEHTVKKLQNMMPTHAAFSVEQQDQLFRADALERLHHIFLEGPFQLCHRILRSKVKRYYSSIYDLSVEKMGQQFDLVFLGDILVHTIYPLKALASAAALCRGTLILSQVLPDVPDYPPVMVYQGGDIPGEDDITWWWPNRSCFEALLRKLGFPKVSLVGKNCGQVRPGGGYFERSIIHGTR